MGAELHPPLTENDTKRSRRFASVRRGYDPSEVDEFLTSLGYLDGKPTITKP